MFHTMHLLKIKSPGKIVPVPEVSLSTGRIIHSPKQLLISDMKITTEKYVYLIKGLTAIKIIDRLLI